MPLIDSLLFHTDAYKRKCLKPEDRDSAGRRCGKRAKAGAKQAETKKPAAKKPATKKPVTKKPAAKKPATKKPATKKPATSSGVTIKDIGDGETRAIVKTASGDEVRVEVDGLKRDHKVVSLSVNGSLLGDQSVHEMTPARRQEIQDGVISALTADAKNRPDGFTYSLNDENVDRQLMTGLMSEAYSKAGFSDPIFGKIGSTQYGVVRNGQIVPDTKTLKSYENNARKKPSSQQIRSNNRIRAIEADLNRRGYTLGSAKTSDPRNLRVGRYVSFASEERASKTQSGIDMFANLPRNWKPGDKIPGTSTRKAR